MLYKNGVLSRECYSEIFCIHDIRIMSSAAMNIQLSHSQIHFFQSLCLSALCVGRLKNMKSCVFFLTQFMLASVICVLSSCLYLASNIPFACYLQD